MWRFLWVEFTPEKMGRMIINDIIADETPHGQNKKVNILILIINFIKLIIFINHFKIDEREQRINQGLNLI